MKSTTLSYPNVIAAHRDAVLFEMTSRSMFPSVSVDFFVYQASSDPSQSSSLPSAALYEQERNWTSFLEHKIVHCV